MAWRHSLRLPFPAVPDSVFSSDIRTISFGSPSCEELLDPPGIASLSAPMSPRFLKRQGSRVGNESNDVNWSANETRQDILNVCRRVDALGFNRREEDNFGGRRDGGMLITPRWRAAGTRMFESDR
jgi:hypothetical protein